MWAPRPSWNLIFDFDSTARSQRSWFIDRSIGRSTTRPRFWYPLFILCVYTTIPRNSSVYNFLRSRVTEDEEEESEGRRRRSFGGGVCRKDCFRRFYKDVKKMSRVERLHSTNITCEGGSSPHPPRSRHGRDKRRRENVEFIHKCAINNSLSFNPAVVYVPYMSHNNPFAK